MILYALILTALLDSTSIKVQIKDTITDTIILQQEQILAKLDSLEKAIERKSERKKKQKNGR